jgi:hypothetical protein
MEVIIKKKCKELVDQDRPSPPLYNTTFGALCSFSVPLEQVAHRIIGLGEIGFCLEALTPLSPMRDT